MVYAILSGHISKYKGISFKKNNKPNKNKRKWESSATLETRFKELHHLELKDEIVRWIKENTNIINI